MKVLGRRHGGRAAAADRWLTGRVGRPTTSIYSGHHGNGAPTTPCFRQGRVGHSRQKSARPGWFPSPSERGSSLQGGVFLIKQGVCKRTFAEVATFRQRFFIWLSDRICGSSGLWRLLPRLRVRCHNSWRSASWAGFREAVPPAACRSRADGRDLWWLDGTATPRAYVVRPECSAGRSILSSRRA